LSRSEVDCLEKLLSFRTGGYGLWMGYIEGDREGLGGLGGLEGIRGDGDGNGNGNGNGNGESDSEELFRYTYKYRSHLSPLPNQQNASSDVKQVKSMHCLKLFHYQSKTLWYQEA